MANTHFKDLTVWQAGSELVVLTYRMTKEFPADEKYILSSQMKRASISVTSNIAEGFGRKTQKDKDHFYVMAYGSLTELENQFMIAEKLRYLDELQVIAALQGVSRVKQLLGGLLRAHRARE